MMKKLILIFALLFTFVFSGASYADEPDNLTSLKQTLKHYHDSGEYFYDLSKVGSSAYDYLQERIDENNAAKKRLKLAIVLDIDETTLSNYQLMLKSDFSTQWAEHMKDFTATKIQSTYQLVRLAQANDVAVFFITGRPEKLRDVTVKNLHDVGYKKWAKLYLRPNNYKHVSAVPYKSATRKAIEEQGYDVVVNVGDQYSDLKGGYADRNYKLPDPFYYVP